MFPPLCLVVFTSPGTKKAPVPAVSAFTLSLDDFTISYFTTRPLVQNLSTLIYSAAQSPGMVSTQSRSPSALAAHGAESLPGGMAGMFPFIP